MIVGSERFQDAARAARRDMTLQEALAGLRGGLVAQRAAAKAKTPDFEAMRDHARDIRSHTLANLDLYLAAYIAKAEANGISVHVAETADEARRIIGEICEASGARVVTKGKSMVSEEIGLNGYLAVLGIEAVETDLGEYIVQLRGEAPSHIIAPAIHVTEPQVEALFRRVHRDLAAVRRLDRATDLVGEARTVMRQRFLAANVGITGANFLVAETGSAVVVTNEGNGDLTANLPSTHVVLASIEKVVPTLADAMALLRVLGRSATGQDMTAYTSFFSGPRRDGETTGPTAMHVVILDNGRSALVGGPFEEMLSCIRCGACLNHCPIYTAVGGHAYGSVYPGPIGAALTPHLAGLGAAHHLPNASTLCGRCEDVCPVRIPIPRLLRQWRERAFEERIGSAISRRVLRLWVGLALRPRLYGAVMRLLVAGLERFGRRRGRFGWLPFASSWTRERDLAAPQGRTFQQLWAERQRGVEP